jgi:Ca-activated chloride channel family protein
VTSLAAIPARSRSSLPTVRVLVLLLGALLAVPAVAHAQTTDTRNRALIVLDASKSMNEDAGNGGSRLDAAKQAFDELVQRLPEGAPIGLRVYGSKVAEVSKAQACKDTELTIPVGPLDKGKMTGTVHALQGKGRTPIGASLLATPDDLGSAAGRRSVVLVSDGGDNCAPPDPCKAAETVAKRGVDLSISVVGLQVNERVRKQLECIARAGGGSYVDVQDAGKLGEELAAALARAFRSYEPVGTKVQGAADEQATPPDLGPGQFLDTLQPGDERWYAVNVPAGKRLFASVTAIPSKTAAGQAALETELVDPAGHSIDNFGQVMYGKAAGEAGRERSYGFRSGFAGTEDAPVGRYRLHVKINDDGIDPEPIPVELGVQLLAPGQAPALVRSAGALATPTPTPKAKATATPAPNSPEDSGTSWTVVLIVAVVGLVLGLVIATVFGRRPT